MVLKLLHLKYFSGAFCRATEGAKKLSMLFFPPETCSDAFYEWTVKERLPSKSQCALWEATDPHRRQAAKLAKFLALKHGKR